MKREVLIVGRGASVYEFDWSTIGTAQVMAVSSGVFALPETVMPAHFASIDSPKYFLDTLADSEIHWARDQRARHWPFWREPDIQKHTVATKIHHGKYRHFPGMLIDDMPEAWRMPFMRAMTGKIHEFGFQPGWGDFPNVKGWNIQSHSGPNFTGSGPFGLERRANSMLFAVQLAVALGYRTLKFIGVDLYGSFGSLYEQMKGWYTLATEAGIEWINLSPSSSIATFMPTETFGRPLSIPVPVILNGKQKVDWKKPHDANRKNVENRGAVLER